jgi:predicted nucleic acid-binding protein
LLKIVRVWPVDLTLALPYAEAYHELKQAGAALSQVDLMLAAFCGRSGPTLLTADKDFEAIRGISTENWLKSPT